MVEKILQFFISLLSRWQNRQSLKTLGATRSPEWRRVRAEHLRKNPACAICGEQKLQVEVHHKQPFHLKPELELEPTNLITLCESGKNGVVCHRFFGHLGNYKTINPAIDEDSKAWKGKIDGRMKNPA